MCPFSSSGVWQTEHFANVSEEVSAVLNRGGAAQTRAGWRGLIEKAHEVRKVCSTSLRISVPVDSSKCVVSSGVGLNRQLGGIGFPG